MKAIISELWDTGIDIIVTEDEFESFGSIANLRKCDNVLVGEKTRNGITEILIDDSIMYVSFRTVTHPTGCGELQICEIY